MKKTTKTKTTSNMHRLPTPIWDLLKETDDETLAKIEHVRKELNLNWPSFILFLLKKAYKPNTAKKAVRQRG